VSRKTLKCSVCGQPWKVGSDTVEAKCAGCTAWGPLVPDFPLSEVEPMLREAGAELGWPNNDKRRAELAERFALCFASCGLGHMRVKVFTERLLRVLKQESQREDWRPVPLGHPIYPRRPVVQRLLELRDLLRNGRGEADLSKVADRLNAEGFTTDAGRRFDDNCVRELVEQAGEELAAWVLGLVFERTASGEIRRLDDEKVTQWRTIPLATEVPVEFTSWADREPIDSPNGAERNSSDERQGCDGTQRSRRLRPKRSEKRKGRRRSSRRKRDDAA